MYMLIRTTMVTEIHSLESLKVPAAWPAQISRTRDLLELPLPSWCSDRPYNLSLNDPTLSGTPTKSSIEDLFENPSLRDFYELASRTVATVKSAMSHPGPRMPWPFVRGFTSILAASSSQNAIILSHTPFVRPCVIPPDDRFDGIAEIVACHVVQGFRGTDDSLMLDDEKPSASFARSHSNTTSSQEIGSRADANQGNHPNETSTRDSDSAEPSAESDSDEIPDSQSSPSIDVCLNGHIFQGSGKHSYALLPFLCIADAQNILELMASVACQRFVWGISEPAIGFLLSPSGALMELVISWVDQSTRVVHIAHDIGQRPGPGSFDFSNLASTLRFSQFIRNLSPSFSAVASDASRTCANNRLDWRSDNPGFGDFETCTHRVEQWVSDVQLSRRPLAFPSAPPQPSSVNSDTGSEIDIPSTMSRKLDSTQSKSARYPTDSTRSKAVRSDSLDVSASEESVPSSRAGTSRFSSSSLAGRSVNEEADETPHLLTYTFDRLIRFLTVDDHPQALFGEEGAEIDVKKELYMTMTAFQWFPALDPFPDVSGVLRPYKRALCSTASAIVRSLPTTSTLDPQHQTIIQRQIFVLLGASAGANILRARIGIKAYEAESRHDWDALLYCFYIADEEIVSRNILLERTMHFSKNLLAEVEDFNRLAEIVKDATHSSTAFCLNALINATRTGEYGRELDMQATLAVQQAQATLASYRSLCDHQQKLQQLIQRRSRREPKDGKCDAMCFFAVSAPSSFEAADVAALGFLKYTKEEPAIKQKVTKTGESDSSIGRGAGHATGKTVTNEEKPTKKGETDAPKAIPTLNNI
ncbi:hypothetical protein B0H15DRAFT_565214 [Mycena belliarum]|uniref:Uncharacterized protein n=1 Tax=Mycena belliarum TaxID=1033014 RepID=A0AAD6TU03_9AGAR|nr:hypothetical protein B0H15DRAFT_565214 [Mycena belliae]